MATLNTNFPVKYYSDSQAKRIDTHVSQVATDGSIEVHCKLGMFQHIGNISQKLKLMCGKPIPEEFLTVLQSHHSAKVAPRHHGDWRINPLHSGQG